ncbi:MAG: hypothetical protein WBG69_05270 [Arcobacteraceae bacterium]
MKNNHKNTSTTAENLLLVLPKNCGCSACTSTKEYAKNELGEHKYKSILKTLGILG